ncbi:MAG TPA: tetratricopeptide repeat protein [Candidatus Deferrimicrobiaceae bacterium]|jgi:peroxiredoxin
MLRIVKNRASLFVSTILVGLIVFTVPGTGSAFRNLKEGAPALPFSLNDADGKPFEFKPDGGKVTVLSFLKLSQDRSVDQIKDLVTLSNELTGKGVEFIIVASYTDNVEDAKKITADLGVKFPILMDRDQKVYSDYGLYILPTTGIIGKDGKFAFEHASHGRDFKDLVGGKARVMAGLMKEEEYQKLITPVEIPKKSKEEGEAEKELNFGKTLMKRGMIDKAGAAFAKAVAFDPKNVHARIAYGESLVALKQLDNAFVQFDEAKKIAPTNREAQLGIGAVHLEKGAIDNAITEITAAAQLNPKPEKAWYWLGMAYEKKGDMKNAVLYYRKAVEKLIKE